MLIDTLQEFRCCFFLLFRLLFRLGHILPPGLKKIWALISEESSGKHVVFKISIILLLDFISPSGEEGTVMWGRAVTISSIIVALYFFIFPFC